MAELTRATQDYLKRIWSATEWSDEPVTTGRLARDLGLSPSTVSESIAKLAREGLVEHRRYQSVTLTEEGTRHALRMVRAHRLIETFLHSRLGYSWDEIHDEADALEHAVSLRFIEAIDEHLGRPEYDPHGDPIPRPDGAVPPRQAIPLEQAADGEATVLRVDDSDPERLREASTIGLYPGQAVRIDDGVVSIDDAAAEIGRFEGGVWVTDNR